MANKYASPEELLSKLGTKTTIETGTEIVFSTVYPVWVKNRLIFRLGARRADTVNVTPKRLARWRKRSQIRIEIASLINLN